MWEGRRGLGPKHTLGAAALPRYCDAVLSGRDAAREFPEINTHIANRAACREDTEGLLAALRQIEGDKE